jgi:hypothetical protein
MRLFLESGAVLSTRSSHCSDEGLDDLSIELLSRVLAELLESNFLGKRLAV